MLGGQGRRKGRKATGRGVRHMDDRRLLSGGYRLDESDSDVLVLRREDGSFVAAFSTLGCSEGSVRRAMEEDRAKGERSHRLTAPVR